MTMLALVWKLSALAAFGALLVTSVIFLRYPEPEDTPRPLLRLCGCCLLYLGWWGVLMVGRLVWWLS